MSEQETMSAAEFRAMQAEKERTHKYGAVKASRTLADGTTHRFDSKAEARRYDALRLAERAGEITALELQPAFPIAVNGRAICTYRADFRYTDRAGRVVVEDVKGVKTPVYRLKKKLTEAQYGITITEVTNED